MNLPKVWGQGQLFCFSALDGEAYCSDDFAGMLSGDRIGIKFYSSVRREFAVVGCQTTDLIFDAVCGDYISARTDKGEIKILYTKAHLIVGEVCETALPVVYVEGKYNSKTVDNIEIQDTMDGEFTALLQDGEKFAFAFGKSEDEVVALVKEGIAQDISKEEEKKKAYYEQNSVDGKYAQLYAKCMSVMKTQLCSPEAQFDRIWSTPDRIPHQHLWIWDSVFHGLGFRHINGKIAEDLILAIFCSQFENGFIPCRAGFGLDHRMTNKNDTQSPVIAWGAWNVYQYTKNKEFLKEVYKANGKFLEWCFKNRMKRDNLFSWRVNERYLICKCGESGMDNSPRFDDAVYLLAIDFSCFMANEMRFMDKIAKEIGEDTEFYAEQYDKMKASINNILWDEETGFYYDYDLEKERLHKVKSSASFMALFAGVCDGEKGEKLLAHLNNKNEFNTEFPIPSISVDDPKYGIDMWKGPVWLNINYMTIEGLKELGYTEKAKELTERMLDIVMQWYEFKGVVYEFYDSSNKIPPNLLKRKGDSIEPYNIDIRVQSIRDFGWSLCLSADLIKRL